jgi:ABC-type phosphate transport system auxiliary subunit
LAIERITADATLVQATAALHEDMIQTLKSELAQLRFNNARLQAEVDRLTAVTTRTIIPNEELQAEVERLTNNCDYLDQKLDDELDKSAMLCGQVDRLTKAGDALASSIQFNEEIAQDYNGPTIVHQCVQRWNAAKEGKKS